jgi:2,4-dienoyl-CoA reductase-like NADH-dependent reductase (Old Yellow Enzyme family)
VLPTNAQGLRVHRAPGIPHALGWAEFIHSSGASRREIARLRSARPSFPGREIKHSCQMPPLEYIGRHADIMTIAGGLIIHDDQAKPALRNKQADLIAIGRKILNDPN